MSKLSIYSDGASKGNPGPAGIGVVIAGEDGTVLREIAEYVGELTNNAAEYLALIRGLREAADLGADQIELHMDSELMARQLTGVYKVKSPNLQPLHEEAVGLLRCFRRVTISHVMREFNKRADELANEGIKKHRQALSGKREKPEPKGSAGAVRKARARLVQIGESVGVQIPGRFIDKLGLRDEVEVSLHDDHIEIHPSKTP